MNSTQYQNSTNQAATSLDQERTAITLGAEIARARVEFEQASLDGKTRIHIALGNEAADLDSVCTSIAQAIILRRTLQDGSVAVPVINIPREELALRKDVLRVLDLAGISPRDLLFIDDATVVDRLISEGRLKVHLIDHNELAVGQEKLAPAVVNILDHHVDTGTHYPLLNQENRLINKCASAATLLANKILHCHPEHMTFEVATLLLTAMTIDTRNFNDKGPGTQLDSYVSYELYPRVTDVVGPHLYNELMDLREDVSGLSLQQLLTKDIKVYRGNNSQYAITSLPRTVAWTEAEDATFEGALKELSATRGLSMIAVLLWEGASPNDKRTIKIFAVPPNSPTPIANKLLGHAQLGKTLSCGHSSSDSIETLYSSQMLLRKQLQPAIADVGL